MVNKKDDMLKIAHRRAGTKRSKISGSKTMKKAAHKPKKSKAKSTPKTWQSFVGERMSSYMKKYGGHAEAMKQIAKEWRKYKAGL